MSSQPAVQGGARLKIGKYLVFDHLATGSMSAVYRAQDAVTGKPIALKVLPLDKAARPEFLERFQREARIGARLDHENVVGCLDSGEENGIHFIAFEYVDGANLLEFIADHRRLPIDEAQAIIVQAARALAHLHEHGIVHRDIKPANFLLVRRGGPSWLVKLVDFGLARDLQLARNGNDPCTQSVVPGVTVGTPDYIAPEQARASFFADARSDLYALGGTWYHMLTGQPPFPEGNASEKIRSHFNLEVPDVRDLNGLVPRATAAVLQRLLMKEPDFRYQSAVDLLEALEPPPARTAKSGRWWFVLAALLAGSGERGGLWRDHAARARQARRARPRRSEEDAARRQPGAHPPVSFGVAEAERGGVHRGGAQGPRPAGAVAGVLCRGNDAARPPPYLLHGRRARHPAGRSARPVSLADARSCVPRRWADRRRRRRRQCKCRAGVRRGGRGAAQGGGCLRQPRRLHHHSADRHHGHRLARPGARTLATGPAPPRRSPSITSTRRRSRNPSRPRKCPSVSRCPRRISTCPVEKRHDGDHAVAGAPRRR